MDNPQSGSLEAIAREFAHFFQAGALTASYKPVILRAILYLLRQRRVREVENYTLLAVEDISRYFLRFNFVLYRRFHLRQLTSKRRPAHVYRIIDAFFPEDAGFRVPREIPRQAIQQVRQLLFRHVLFLLRRDARVYEFFREDCTQIEMKQDISDEQDFLRSLQEQHLAPNDIMYLGMPGAVTRFIEAQQPVLEAASTANLAIFLEKLNPVPNLNAKILKADRAPGAMRNIGSGDKEKLYAYQVHRCFYCGGDLGETPEADHFIPYDYIFDSPIWNMVGACRSCNGKKSNHLVREEFLTKLLNRNNDSRFQDAFEDHMLVLGSYPELTNAMLEQHYRLCRLYFKMLGDDFP